ncbi:CLUMA_CG004732, isoform A [Clunio marinus]|uniref:CLUMA_CG004732, isoform A n=1 Tax=Clunio marinus TaxID=568069 RepID=A0A1J1HUK1_9DIPT|nr:CLUMA_CG004732, isoform A [Clunio marinus]
MKLNKKEELLVLLFPPNPATHTIKVEVETIYRRVYRNSLGWFLAISIAIQLNDNVMEELNETPSSRQLKHSCSKPMLKGDHKLGDFRLANFDRNLIRNSAKHSVLNGALLLFQSTGGWACFYVWMDMRYDSSTTSLYHSALSFHHPKARRHEWVLSLLSLLFSDLELNRENYILPTRSRALFMNSLLVLDKHQHNDTEKTKKVLVKQLVWLLTTYFISIATRLTKSITELEIKANRNWIRCSEI